MYLSGPYSSCFSAENRSAAAGSKVIGAHEAPLGRLQLEFRPKLVKPMFRAGEEDKAQNEPSILSRREARIGTKSISRGSEPSFKSVQIAHPAEAAVETTQVRVLPYFQIGDERG